MLGLREPDLYGTSTYSELVEDINEYATSLEVELEVVQSNSEDMIIKTIHSALKLFDAIIINPGGLAHTSIALRDALLSISIPFIEVHISNIYSRESFRHHSFISDIAVGVISGLGIDGYKSALDYFSRNETDSKSR